MSKAKNPSGDKQPASKRDGMSMLEASNVWLEAQQKIGEAWLASSRRMLEEQGKRVSDPLGAQEAFAQLGQSLMRDPSALSAAQTNLLKQYFDVYARMLGMETEHDESASQNQDRRFKDESWSKNPLFEALKQAYLATGKVMLDMVQTADGLDDSTRARLDFVVRQIIDAASPTNFALTNPEVLRATIESGGANLVSGLKNLIDDLSRSNERLDIAMVDKSAFKVGETLAVTPGKVIYRNRLFELLQYEPVTEQVCKRPLLVIPPWMNKFYILDLRPGNSFIEWLVSQEQTVFVVSWVNPDRSLADASFDTYLLEGAVDAVDVVLEATGEPELNVVGYCLGGILTAAMLAYMAGKQDKRVKSATLLTTMVDFKDAGELKLFINEKSLPELEAQIDNDGYLDGRTLYDATRAIRANDLIWSFYVNNYLLGKEPFPFDLLYWNSDSTRMPAKMHSWYLRNMYLNNRLCKAELT
ncbi:MAG: alpha/beta fold hydrolase, partial [Gammaproteobacteria bacterium]|nr:alpha/beta fold hydrolase [Gammaproteobacteria bacterium]